MRRAYCINYVYARKNMTARLKAKLDSDQQLLPALCTNNYALQCKGKAIIIPWLEKDEYGTHYDP